jgi:hypothetical protein
MKLCPNCKNPFEEIAGRLHCPEHGWHGLNGLAEIIPASEPTPEEMAVFESKQKAAAEQQVKILCTRCKNSDCIEEPEYRTFSECDEFIPDAPVIQEQNTVTEPSQGLPVNERTIYIAAVILGVVIVGLGLYRLYKIRKNAQ